MAANIVRNTLKSMQTVTLRTLTSHHHRRRFSLATATAADSDKIYVKAPPGKDASSVTMPTSSMTGSIVGKRFYKKVTTRLADDGTGWHVMLDSRTLKTPSKRPLKLPTHSLAMAIAAEWDY